MTSDREIIEHNLLSWERELETNEFGMAIEAKLVVARLKKELQDLPDEEKKI